MDECNDCMNASEINCEKCEKDELTASPVERGVMWRVVADHQILRRPDKGNMTKNEAMAYADSLRPLGYENINVIIDGAT